MKKFKIMTVEDNELFAMILDFNLREGLNFEIKNVLSGEECLAHLNWNPDLIILDYELPKMNGLETFKEIKKIKPGIKVIALTSQLNVQVAVDFIKEGAIHYIEKNNNPTDKLLNFIDDLQYKKEKKGIMKFLG